MSDIKIILIDDHTLFRSGIKALLSRQQDFDVVGEAADGLAGVKLVEQLRPDIVLLDLDMPLMNGVEALAQMLDNQPGLPVLILTISEHADNLQKCLSLGARGYILKNADTGFLVDAIHAALEGRRTVSAEMTGKRQQKSVRPQPEQQLPEALTMREKEVLRYIAAGMSNKLIADKMSVSENTVKVHVQNILRKLHLNSRVQAAVFAGKMDWEG